jgi:hypothetical protein
VIAFFSCPACRAKDVPVENIRPRLKHEDEQRYLYRVFTIVGNAHDRFAGHGGCKNRQIQVAIPDPNEQKELGAA